MSHRRLARAAACVLLCIVALGVVGCSGSGQLSVRNATETGDSLTGSFDTAVYAFTDHNQLEIVLIEGPDDAPTQAVHLRMEWRPKAGATPVDRRSTNTTVRYIVFTGDGAGVYSGAGFLYPNNKPGGDSFRGTLRSTSIRLRDASVTFADRIGRAKATGSFTAERDELATKQHLRRLQQQVSAKLGYPLRVAAPSEQPIAANNR